MAHLAKLGALTDELVTLLTSTSAQSDPTRFSIHRESALRSIRYSNYLRTDQFDVSRQLEGLEEKFRVYNEDPLADALKERVKLIFKLTTKWTPEVLHLLLELSYKPVTKSRLEDLEFLKEPEADAEPALKWRDLAAEDPLLREKKIWKNVDFGAESSEDEEGFEDDRSESSGPTESTLHSSVDEDYHQRPEDFATHTLDEDGLKKVQKAQFWREGPSVGGVKLETVKKAITELEAVREVIFMLGGSPTSLFETDAGKSTSIRASKGYMLKHTSSDAFFKVTQDFASHGTAVSFLRSWASSSQSSPLLQILQGSIQERTLAFDKHLSTMQDKFVALKQDVVVSLLLIQDEVKPFVKPLVRLAEIIRKLHSEPYSHAFRYLEMLFDETCSSQMAGDDAMYIFMGRIFFQCFQVYLRPIRKWMEDGELERGDKVFFVSESSAGVELAALWQSRFKIRKTTGGVLHAPRFLSAAANKIFTTGKSVVLLKHLNCFDTLCASRINFEPRLDFDNICDPSTLALAPFSELFDTAFNNWIESKHQHASALLRKTLFDSCGLHTALSALTHIYFMSDGIIASAFTSSIFDKLDTLNKSWNDRFTLTELAQGTIGSIASISADRLRVTVDPLSQKHQDITKCRKTVKILPILAFKYHLSWPIQTILTPATISSYQRIFTFLLQIRRSSHILSRQRIVNDTFTYSSSSDDQLLFYSLRTRLLWFTQMIYYYLTALVLEPCSKKMQSDLEEAADVDAMIQVHSSSIKATTDQALLGSKLELIQKTILKILDLGIKLQDAQAANALAYKQAMEEQQEMMDLSMASLGLHTPRRNGRRSHVKAIPDSDSSADDEDLDVDLSILSTFDEQQDELPYVEKLRKMKDDFDRSIRFVASGLRGVARAGGGQEAKSWDILAEMLESGLATGAPVYH